MAAVDPYSPCPCGSGQKFKWCCHKVEAYAERAHRLFENGQTEAALDALDEGLRKEPGNAWLLTRKALYLIRSHQSEPAKEAVATLLRAHPKHLGGHMLMTRLVLETEGAAAGAAQLQAALTAYPDGSRSDLAPLVRVVGTFLTDSGDFSASIAHLRLARALAKDGDDLVLDSALRAIEQNPRISPWEKDQPGVAPAPEGLAGEARARFTDAVGWANEGLWSSAAAAFEMLSSDPAAGPLADRNLGFCRLWLADDVAAVAALRRYAARLGTTTEAVDLEALCQLVAPPGSGGMVDHVQLIWPLRDRQKLLDSLRADPTVHDDGPGPIDQDDENSPEVDQFELLDRPGVTQAAPDLKAEDIPRIVGRVLVGQEIAALEAYDDGRLDGLSERLTALAGPAIPPAHPKTKPLGKVPRLDLALSLEWLPPEDVEPEQGRRLAREQSAYLLREVWPRTPNPALGGKTPLEAAEAGGAEVPLRAAIVQFEQGQDTWRTANEGPELRRRLHLPPEPEVDPATADVAALHLARLAYVPADRLGDEPLVTLYRRARGAALDIPLERAARALVERPEAMERLGVESAQVYSDLASIASARFRMDEAFDWVRRGRQADAPSKRGRNAATWDVLEVRLRARAEPPEVWVPEVAVLLDRYRQDPQSTQVVLMSLIDMGLIRMMPNPDGSGEIMLDGRPLQSLLDAYGPRVTTASGRLGVSATRPEIWTPGGAGSGASGGLYIPGSGSGGPPPQTQGGGPSKLIVPGQ